MKRRDSLCGVRIHLFCRDDIATERRTILLSLRYKGRPNTLTGHLWKLQIVAKDLEYGYPVLIM